MSVALRARAGASFGAPHVTQTVRAETSAAPLLASTLAALRLYITSSRALPPAFQKMLRGEPITEEEAAAVDEDTHKRAGFLRASKSRTFSCDAQWLPSNSSTRP